MENKFNFISLTPGTPRPTPPEKKFFPNLRKTCKPYR